MFNEETYHIALFGFGTIGKGVYEIINNKETENLQNIDIEFVYVREEKVAELSKKYPDLHFTSNVEEILNDDCIDIVVEAMGGIEPAFTIAKKAMIAGKDFVTCNKMLVANKYNELKKISNDTFSKLCYEASVGAGIHIFHSIYDIKKVDTIQCFIGIINGTSNYILTKMEQEGRDFDDVLKETQKLGFAERDPSDDIDGIDPKYKALILNNFIYDKSYDLNKVINFGIRYISQKDFIYAANEHKTIKLIATGDSENSFVIPMFLSEDDVLAKVDKNYNALEVFSNNLGSSVYVGPGAGSLPTAHGVVLDVVNLINGDTVIYPYEYDHADIKNDLKANFYIRYKDTSIFNNILDHAIDDDTIVTKEIDIKDLYELTKDLKDIFVAKI